VVIILFVENVVPLSFLLVTSTPATASASAVAPSASAAAPLIMLCGGLGGLLFWFGVSL
jgi:hypothetical protein